MSASSKNEGRLKERFREATRVTLLDAAEEAFASHGIEGARVDDIAAAAGVSVGTLYNHFGDRRQLLEALLEGRREAIVARLDEVLQEGREGPFAALLDRFVRALLSHFDAHRALFQIVMEEEASHLRIRPHGEPVIHALAGRAEQLVHLGVEKGGLRAEDATHLPFFLIATIWASLVRAKSEDKREPLEQLAPVVVRFFLSGAQR